MTRSRQAKPELGREILGVFTGFIALYLLLCLVSHTIPSPDTASLPANWGGAFGGFIAVMLLGFMGLAAFWLPMLLCYCVVRLFSPDFTLDDLPFTMTGCFGILLASSGLAGSIPFTTLSLFGHTYPVAGHLGAFLAHYGGRFFGGPGSVLLFVVLLLVSLMLATSFSPYVVVVALWERWQEQRKAREQSRLDTAESRDKGASITVVKAVSAAGDGEETPKVHEPVRLKAAELPDEQEEGFRPLPASGGAYQRPGLNLLDRPEHREIGLDRDYYFAVSKELEEKLKDFGVEGKVVGISPGPVITTYEFSPAPGVKINRIISLADDLALGLKAESVRIVGSIPGKAALGIEIPNPERQVVFIRDILAHEKFQKAVSKLTIGLGMDVVGNPVVADLARMPHLLIAGATGSGKSVAVNAIVCSILLNATPEEVRLLLVDPKRIELSCYEEIPHLLHPVVVDPRLASRALQWAVREMERRYQLMEEARVKSLASYNAEAAEKLPLIVIIIDELADLMMVSSKEVEDAVARLAQMARAAGMHLILATQRPSVDVLTGLIKANFPTRMSFKVSSKIDSRTILDGSGAEHLLGAGDMLFMPPGASKLQRIHGAYISEKETERIVAFLREQGSARYDESMLKIAEEAEQAETGDDVEMDAKYDEAVALVCESGQASISMVQRRLRIGYNRAARMIELMEREGVIGPADGAKPREVLARKGY